MPFPAPLTPQPVPPLTPPFSAVSTPSGAATTLSVTSTVHVAAAPRTGTTSADVGTAPSATVVLVGRLDAVEAPALRAALTRVLDAGVATVVIDLVDVGFVDSAGLAALVRARRDARAAGGDVVLVRPADDNALRVFRLTQFDEVFQMVDAKGSS